MTFKAKIVANELVNTDISAVSLVKHAASRAPFKLLKTEDTETAPTQTGLKASIDHVFGKGEDPQVSFVAIKNADTNPALIEKMEAAGFVSGDTESHGDVTIYKQEGFIEEVGSLITLSPDVAVGLDQVVKGFDPWVKSTDFNETVGAATFFPALWEAVYALTDTIAEILGETHAKADATALTNTALSSFSKHVKGLISSIPESVIKMDLSLQREFASSTVSPTTDTSDDEGNQVSKNETVIPEAVAGDLAGLNTVEKTEEPATTDTVNAEAADAASAGTTDGLGNEVQKDEGTGGEPTVETPEILTKTRKVKKGEEVVEMQVSYYIDADGVEVETETVEKAEQLEGQDAVLAAIGKLSDKLSGLDGRLDAVEKSQTETLEAATAATTAAQNSVVHRGLGDVDQSLGTNRPPAGVDVQKSDGDLWRGTMPAFD